MLGSPLPPYCAAYFSLVRMYLFVPRLKRDMFLHLLLSASQVSNGCFDVRHSRAEEPEQAALGMASVADVGTLQLLDNTSCSCSTLPGLRPVRNMII